ncbi:hypothetical protein ACE38W_03070 [Chitinophaga sp. Hz27]|uniref:hypothetical protein n=1 Tax=Chitinophaga sp. Hz27 TaxID=3347169 RepID=UPI0035E1B42D
MPLNVKFSKIGWALSNNRPLTRYIAHRSSHLTKQEKHRGFFEIPVKGEVLIVFVGPDQRTKEEKARDGDNIVEYVPCSPLIQWLKRRFKFF